MTLSVPEALLIGDDTPTRLLMRLLLEADGYTVQVCASTCDAPPLPAAALVALVDPALGDLAATMQRLHRLGDRAAAVVLTHNASPELRRRAFAMGVRDVISLPAVPREMAVRLHVAAGANHAALAHAAHMHGPRAAVRCDDLSWDRRHFAGPRSNTGAGGTP